MKILITGNSGYIGSHLIKRLLTNTDYKLYGLDTVYPNIIPYKFYQHDIKNWFNLEEEFDCVIHLAAKVSVNESVRDPILYYTTNTIGTLNVLETIKTKQFICASTGAADTLSSPYGISKKAMEEVVEQYCLLNSIPFTIFRFYNVIGSDGISPTNPDGLFFNLIKAIETKKFNLYGTDYNTKDGTCIRDYVHVNEICDSIIKAINNNTNSIENLGHGIGYSVKEIIEEFKQTNSVDFQIEYCPRREGDAELSVLESPSTLMTKLYSLNELLRIS